MPHPTKIATCCFCGSRTTLKPTAREGHELACGSCGAPLHEMKWLKMPERAPAPAHKPPKKPKPYRPEREKPRKSYKPRKRRKTVFRKILEEAWDIAEDIFD